MAMITKETEDRDTKSYDRSCAKKGTGRSRKNGGKRYRNRNKSDESRGVHVSETNDISWYDKNPALLKAAASLPYAYPVGDNLDLQTDQYRPGARKMPTFSRMPGILTIDIVPGPGISNGAVGGEISAVNVAARDIYSFVRYANSGHSNYDPADLMMYMLAIDEVFMELADAQRIYGVVNLINPQNRYVPKYLVEALGWDYEDVIRNLAQFRFAINSAAARIAALNMPMGFPYFDRHRWLFSNLYVDGTSPKAQLLAFKKVMYRMYDETGDHGSALDNYSREDKLTVSQWSTLITEMINALVGSEDCGIISGDILKAFGTDKCYSAQYMPDNYYVVPSYDEEVLSQIANATIYEGYDHAAIRQDPSINKGTIIYQPNAHVRTGHSSLTDLNPAYGKQIVSFQKDTVTPEDTIVGTRLTTILNSTGATFQPSTYKEVAPVLTCGSEIAVGAHVWFFHKPINSAMTLNNIVAPTFLFSLRDKTTKEVLNPSANPFTIIADLAKFRFHTPVVMTEVTMDNNVYAAEQWGGVNYIRDIDTYTVVDAGTLKNMHEQSILSEFSTPITIKVSGKL